MGYGQRSIKIPDLKRFLDDKSIVKQPEEDIETKPIRKRRNPTICEPKSKNPRTDDFNTSDTSLSPAVIFTGASDNLDNAKYNETIIEKAKNNNLVLSKCGIVKTRGYYNEHSNLFAKHGKLWLDYRDMETLLKPEELTADTMFFALNVYIKSNDNYKNKYGCLYITDFLSGILNNDFNEDEINTAIYEQKMFFNENIIYICPFLMNKHGHNNHWLLAIINFETKEFHFFNSSKTFDTPHFQRKYFNNCKLFLQNTRKTYNGPEDLKHFDGNWKLKIHKTAKQRDNYSCGKFVLGFCRYFMEENLNLMLENNCQEQITFFKNIIYEESDDLTTSCLRCRKDITPCATIECQCDLCKRFLHEKCVNMRDITKYDPNHYIPPILICEYCVRFLERP